MKDKLFMHLLTYLIVSLTAAHALYVNYHEGWNLAGLHTSKEMNISRFADSADIAWIYRDGRWMLASPDGRYKRWFQRLPYEKFETVSAGEGAWLHFTHDSFGYLNQLDIHDKNITLHRGWQLLALKCDVAVDVSRYFDRSRLRIWRYRSPTEEWLTFPYREGYPKIRYLKPSDGFWIYADTNMTVDMDNARSFLESFPSDINITEGELKIMDIKPDNSFQVCGNDSLVLEVSGYFQYPSRLQFDRSHFLDEGRGEYNLTLCSRWGFGKKKVNIHLNKAKSYIFKPVSSIDRLKDMSGIARGDYLYALGYDDGLHIFDVSDPLKPVEAGTLQGDFGQRLIYQDILYGSNTLYLSVYDWNQDRFFLYVVDVEDPKSPKLIKKLEYGDRLPHLALTSDRLYVTRQEANAVDLYDISSRSAIEKLKSLDIDAVDIDTFGKSAYITTPSGIDLYRIDGDDLVKKKSLLQQGKIYKTGITPQGDTLYFSFRDSNRKSHVGFYRISDGRTVTTKAIFIDETRAITKPFGNTFVINGILGYDYRDKKKVLVVDRDKLFLDEDSYNPFDKILRAYNDGKDCLSFIQVGDYMYIIHFDENTDIFKKDSE